MSDKAETAPVNPLAQLSHAQLLDGLTKLGTLVDAFMSDSIINGARHSDDQVDGVACEIESLMTDLGFYDETGAYLAEGVVIATRDAFGEWLRQMLAVGRGVDIDALPEPEYQQPSAEFQREMGALSDAR